MRTLKFLLTIVTVFCCLQKADAQDEEVFDIVNVKHFDSAGQCKTLKVIDNRNDKTNIGYLRTGPFNKFKTLVASKPLPEFLQTFYASAIDPAKVTDDELLMVVYDFKIMDRPQGFAGMEVGNIFFSADFFRGANGQYRFVASTHPFHEARSDKDVTEDLVEKAEDKLWAYLQAYSCQGPDLKTGRFYTLEEASQVRYLQKKARAIYDTTRWRKGIYYTEKDFLNDSNRIDITATEEGSGNKKKIIFSGDHGKTDSFLKAGHMAYYYSGESWWLVSSEQCIPLEYHDGDFFMNLFITQTYTGTYRIGTVVVKPRSRKEFWKNDEIKDRAEYVLRLNPATAYFQPIARPHQVTP